MSRPKEKKPKKRVLGIFTRWQIVAIALCLIGAVISFVFFRLGSIALASIPETTRIPDGRLGDTIFDAQNSNYTPDAEYPGAYYFSKTGYMVDVPAVTSAVVDNGTFFRLSDNYFVYLTSYDEVGMAADACCREVAPALVPGAVEDNAECTEAYKAHGYYNGYEVTYLVYTLDITAYEQTSRAAIIGYEYEEKESGKVLFFGAVTRNISTKSLAYTQRLASHEVDLFRKVPPKKE